MKKTRLGFLFLLSLLLVCGRVLFSQQEELKIRQTDTKINIDGNLEEWSSFEEIPILVTPEGARLEPSSDLAVTARFAFDAEYFYAAVKAVDDRFDFPERGRRMGDGLTLTFLDPYQGTESDRFLVFPFFLQAKTEGRFAAMPPLESFEASPYRDILSKIVTDKAQKTASYEIAIPWKNILAFRPFIHQKWGINLAYFDHDGDKSKTVQLFQDPNDRPGPYFKRKGRVCLFIAHSPQDVEFESALEANHFFQEEEKTLTLAVNSPSDEQGWELVSILTAGDNNVPFSKPLAFQKGMNIIRFPLETKGQPSGLCDLSLGVRDNKGALRYSEDKQYFLITRSELEEHASKIETVKKGDLYSKDTVFRESLPTLEIRLQWIREAMEKPDPFLDLEPLDEWFKDIKDLIKNIDDGKPALFLPGQLVRLGYRSAVDGKLKSYSVLVPDSYDQKIPLPLFVSLKGFGGDEGEAISPIAMMYYGPMSRRTAGEIIFLTPGGNGLSEEFVGDSGPDVIECINHLKKLYAVNVRNIFLEGLAAGGAEAWRLALLNPTLFKGLIVGTARLSPPGAEKGENIFELLDRAGGLNILILRREQGEPAQEGEIQKVIEKLRELKVNVKYVEVKAGFRGGADMWSEIFSWVDDLLGRDKVIAKPPRKGPEKKREKE